MKNFSNRIIGAKHQAGIGLIELLVSMFIGLFIMAGVVQMFATTTQNSISNSGASRIQENNRYAFYRIGEDIAQAGNLGCFSSPVATAHNYFTSNNVEPINNMLGNASASGNVYDFDNLVHGYDQSVNLVSPAGQIAAGTETLMVRYVNHAVRLDITDSSATDSITVDKDHPSYSSLKQFQVVVASDCTTADIFMITNDPSSSNGLLEHKPSVVSTGLNAGQFNVPAKERISRFVLNNGTSNQSNSSIPYLYAGTTGTYQYFIGSTSGGTCNTTSAPEQCSLFRRANGESRELVRGVHDLEVEYGWTDNSGNLRFGNATAVGTANVWNIVDRMRITLAFNSVENVVTAGNSANEKITRSVTRTFNLPNQL